MRSLPYLALLCLPTAAIAQSTVDLYPGTTSFSSRGSAGTGAGETLQGFHTSHFRGIGGTGPACAAQAFRYTVQDQNSATQESFHIVVRAGSDANGPTTGTTAGARLHHLGPVNLPVVAAGGGHAWTITINLATPATLPCEDFFAIGAEIAAAPTFPADGMSTHASLATVANQHANAADNAWDIVGAATSAVHPSGKRTYRYGMVLAGPSLQMGTNGSYGNGGLFPVVGGSFTGRIDGGPANGQSLLWLDIGIAPGFTLFPGTAQVYLPGVNAKLLTTISLDANGDGVHTLATVPSVTPKITLYFQALLTGGAGPQLSNATATTLDQ